MPILRITCGNAIPQYRKNCGSTHSYKRGLDCRHHGDGNGNGLDDASGVATEPDGDVLVSGFQSSNVFRVLKPRLSSEVVRLGSPANPDAFRPGTTSGPVIGSTWDPTIDHSTFASAATLDVLVVDLGAPLNIPTPNGTLLCGIPALSQFFAAPAGSPFGVAVPLDRNLIGLTACSQAASITPGSGFQLTNALDLTLGSL